MHLKVASPGFVFLDLNTKSYGTVAFLAFCQLWSSLLRTSLFPNDKAMSDDQRAMTKEQFVVRSNF